jgi:hypothetical protein
VLAFRASTSSWARQRIIDLTKSRRRPSARTSGHTSVPRCCPARQAEVDPCVVNGTGVGCSRTGRRSRLLRRFPQALINPATLRLTGVPSRPELDIKLDSGPTTQPSNPCGKYRRLPARQSFTGLAPASDPENNDSMTHHIHKITFKAAAGTGWNALQEQLNTAHEAVRHLAISDGRHGMLITRHSHDAYTLAVSPEVPYGMTYERGTREPSAAGLSDKRCMGPAGFH